MERMYYLSLLLLCVLLFSQKTCGHFCRLTTEVNRTIVEVNTNCENVALLICLQPATHPLQGDSTPETQTKARFDEESSDVLRIWQRLPGPSYMDFQYNSRGEEYTGNLENKLTNRIVLDVQSILPLVDTSATGFFVWVYAIRTSSGEVLAESSPTRLFAKSLPYTIPSYENPGNPELLLDIFLQVNGKKKRLLVRKGESFRDASNRFIHEHGFHHDMLQHIESLLTYESNSRENKFNQLKKHVFEKALLQEPIRVILGAAKDNIEGWLSTQKYTLDITKFGSFLKVFGVSFVDSFLAEHVWEHLTIEEGLLAARNCYDFLRPGGHLRVAVPDLSRIRVKNKTEILKDFEDGHKVQFSSVSLKGMFESIGFEVKVLESNSQRHVDWIPSLEYGNISRCSYFDPRGPVSIILDALKPPDEEKSEDLIYKRAVETLTIDPNNLLAKMHLVQTNLVNSEKDDNKLKISKLTNHSVEERISRLKTPILRPGTIQYLEYLVDMNSTRLLNIFKHLGLDHAQINKLSKAILMNAMDKVYDLNSRKQKLSLDLLGAAIESGMFRRRYEVNEIKEESCNINATLRQVNSNTAEFRWSIVGCGHTEPALICMFLDHFKRLNCVNIIKSEINAWHKIQISLDLYFEKFYIQAYAHNSLGAKILAEKVITYSGEQGLHQNNVQKECQKGSEIPEETASLPKISKPKLCIYTLVLNGMPFIKYHVTQLSRLRIDYEWHIVEGVAVKRAHRSSPYSDSEISSSFYDAQGKSIDGTSEYIDNLAARSSGRVHVHRSPHEDGFWIDKLEMSNTALLNIKSPCILMQIDVDEFWTAHQMENAVNMMNKTKEKRCAYFDCHFFITPELVTVSRGKGMYSHNDEMEWLRLWRFEPGMIWISHAPPSLIRRINQTWEVLRGKTLCYQHSETSKSGLVFTHHAYVLPAQVSFKQEFYGYANALKEWNTLQALSEHYAADKVSPGSNDWKINVAKVLSWVPGTEVLAVRPENTLIGKHVKVIPFKHLNLKSNRSAFTHSVSDHVVIDMVIFQLQDPHTGGISRIWRHLLPGLLLNLMFNEVRVTLLHRGEIAYDPSLHFDDEEDYLNHTQLDFIDFSLLEHKIIAPYVQNNEKGMDAISNLDNEEDRLLHITDALNTTCFLSSAYTLAPGQRNIVLLHDMIPEDLGWDTDLQEWKAKHRSLRNAADVIAVSSATKERLKAYPMLEEGSRVTVVNPGYDDSIFHISANISRERFLLFVGPRRGYKGGAIFFNSVVSTIGKSSPKLFVDRVVFVGSQAPDVSEITVLKQAGLSYKYYGILSDKDLAKVYSKASALLYLSVQEGFGLPVIEAMACGCPVVLVSSNRASVNNAASNEVAFVINDTLNPEHVIEVINRASRPSQVRSSRMQAGAKRAKALFSSWKNFISTVSTIVMG